jgi:hypothetical protein
MHGTSLAAYFINGARLSGVFGQVPAVFARRVTHDADAG